MARIFSSQLNVGHWRDTHLQATYAQAYDQLITGLPEQPERLDISTPHGTVRTLHWPGPHGTHRTPALLIPGRSSGAAQWVENLPAWIGTRPIFAVDPLGDAGFSSQQVPLASIEEQADSYLAVLDALDIPSVHVVGHSFGGAGAANLASRHPTHIRSVALFEPVLVIAPLPATTYLWATMLLLPLPPSWRNHALAKISGASTSELDEAGPMATLIDAASRGYSAALPTPKTMSDKQWQAITSPVRLDIGGQHSLSGSNAAARILKLLPQAKVQVWPTGTHSLPMDKHEEFGRLIPQFWAEAENNR